MYEEKDKVLSLHDEGETVREIKDKVSVTKSTIIRWIKDSGRSINRDVNSGQFSKGHVNWNSGKYGHKLNSGGPTDTRSVTNAGSNSPLWKGGVTTDREKIARWTTEQAPKVHAKFDYTCQICGKRGGKLHAHHVAPVVLKPELAYEFENLVTLCEMCHRELHANEKKIEYRKTKEPFYVLDDDVGAITCMDHMGHDLTVVSRARASFIQDDKTGEDLDGDYKLLRFLARNQHETPFEMCYVTFLVECPIFVARQWHRHRMWSYSEASRRYTSEDIKFYVPKSFRGQSSNNKQGSEGEAEFDASKLEQHTENAVKLYNEMLEAGVAREQARMVLPSNLYTRFYATANLRSIAHFIGLRSDSHAQYEIRQYSNAMYDICSTLFPVSIGALLGE